MSRSGGPSIRQLAESLDVSVATVSRALNDHPEVSPETRERVLAYAAKANYQRRPQKRVGSRTIGLLYPSAPVSIELGNFESALLSGIMSGLREQRYSLSIIDTEHDRKDGESLADLLGRKGISGALVRTPGASSALLDEIAETNIDAVLLADRSDNEHLNYIYCDSRADSARVVDHLHHLGHRRIGLVMHDVLDHDHLDRLHGFRQGLDRYNIPFDESLVVKTSARSIDSGSRALDILLTRDNPPTAVYVTNPIPTVGLLHRCLELGLSVPDDLSIVGFDDRDTRFQTYPNYTAVWQDAAQIGLEAALWLSRRLEGVGARSIRQRRSTMFSVHQTTGPAPENPVRLSRDRVSLITNPQDNNA